MGKGTAHRRKWVVMPPTWLAPGVRVDYRAVVGGSVTLANVRVRAEPWQLGDGSWVVAIEGKAGGVAVEALTPTMAHEES